MIKVASLVDSLVHGEVKNSRPFEWGNTGESFVVKQKMR